MGFARRTKTTTFWRFSMRATVTVVQRWEKFTGGKAERIEAARAEEVSA